MLFNRFKHIIPARDWLSHYNRAQFGSDLLASIIVTIMLIPQSLAYAMLAGLPPQMGLYASILPLLGYALFGSSRTLAVGPVAVVSLLTATTISQLATPGSQDYIQMAILLALLSGLFLLLMGLLRLGFLANLLSHPVISGFISASAILIAVSQLKHLFGVDAAGHVLHEIVPALLLGLTKSNPVTLLIGLLSIVFLLWVRAYLKTFLQAVGMQPRIAGFLVKAGPVVVVIISISAVAGLQLNDDGVRIVGYVPPGIPPLALPVFAPDLLSKLLPAAILISMVGFVESVSVAQSLAAKRRQRVDADQELIGLGVANIAASVSSGYPVTGGFARSVVNYDAGAQTPMAGVFTAVLITLTATFLTPLFFYLPNAVLAATIIVAVLSLVDLAAIRRIWRYSKQDFTAMAGTIIITLVAGVEAGIITGVMLSIMLFLWHTSRPHMAVVGQLPGTEHFRNIERHQVITSAKVLSIRIDESLYFANTRHLEDRIAKLVTERPALTDLVLMCPAVNMIDASALESLETIADRLTSAGIRLHLSEVKGPVLDRLQRSDFFEHFTGQVFLSQYQAMQALDAKTCSDAGKSVTQ